LATFWVKFFNFLSFINIMEPGTHVLSISKVMMWATSLAVVGAVWRGEDATTLIGVAGAQLVAVGNYVHRRQRRGNGAGSEYDVVSNKTSG